VDVVCDVGTEKLPYADDSVDEVHCSHFLEHLTQDERVHFLNEAHRVMRKDAKMTLIVPHWCSNRAYGDPTHKWPAVSEMFFYYLSKPWRKVQAPHTDLEFNESGFSCDFSATWGYSLHPDLVVRNQDYQQHALQFSKEAAQDIIATLVALK
jgi:SAM-dependent methyltransferase